VRGVVAVLFGLGALVWPGVTLATLLLPYGAYALVDAVLAVAGLARRHPAAFSWGVLGLSGVLSVVLGVLLLVAPGAGAAALLWAVGAFAIAFGLLTLILGVRLKGVKDRPARQPA
jgi:uncharacterized membrane protein HdeD (DUF308 family)